MENHGFFSKLFDFSFETFITPSIVKIIYMLLVFFAGLAALVFIIVGFAASAAAGVLLLILSPLIFLMYVIFARLSLEFSVALIRVAENTRQTAENTRK